MTAASGTTGVSSGLGSAERTVLVLVRDVLGAGLMGALVEAEGWTAVYPIEGERADVAVHRLRPAAVLVDGYHAAARSDAFYDASRQRGARTVLFAPTAPWGDLEVVVRQHPHVTLVVPRAGESLAALVRDALLGA